ncbi:MAG TPA: hypothetical protein VHL85_03565 [Burkholderiales bacterium]|nr:hypothetical protein [Burkholderiales bacterium]
MRPAPKLVALGLLAAVIFFTPIVEGLATGKVESMSPIDIAGTLLSLLPLYWWYHLDKAEHHYRAGALMNVGIGLVAIVALPVYLIRSRGWRRGGIAIGYGAAFTGLLYLLEWLGEWLGERLA